MNKRTVFYRKLAYGIGIGLLLYPLALLSRPATIADPEGGRLSAKRIEHGLSQANLGEIDPASATMKLATLGLRGVAVNLLWGQAEDAKKKEDWTRLTSTLEQLALLQPNFITFWKFQSWNVTYNVSVQFDDYRDRYYYVRRGIEFLEEGIEKNKENRDIPQLRWDLGWFIGQKIGRADEHVQYRRLFKADDDFHGEDPPRGSPDRDNWRVSKFEYLNAIDTVEGVGVRNKKSLGKKSEKIFYASPGKSQMSYAEAIENEGEFERGQAAWGVAAEDWRTFGDRWIEHSTGVKLQLGREDELTEAIAQKEQELDALEPGLRDKILEERRAALSPEQLAALDKPEGDRTTSDWELVYKSRDTLRVTDQDVVDRIVEAKPELRKEAGLLSTELGKLRVHLVFTQRYKDVANYDYWKLRAEFEQTEEAVAAREKMYLAKKAYEEDQARDKSKQLYEEGFLKWREVLDRFPDLLDPEGTTGDDLLLFVIEYRDVLRAKDEEIPDDFPLWEIIENFDIEQEFVEEVQQRNLRRGESDSADSNEADETTP